MTLSFLIRGRGRSLVLPTNSAVPTISGVSQETQTLTKAAGTWSAYVELEQKWQESASPFSTWSDIASATATTRVLAAGQVGKKVRIAERVKNGDGWSPYAYSAPTDVVVVASGSALFPATQSIGFGAKTRLGHGGHKMAYAGTGTVTITSQKDASTNDVTFFAINSVNEIVLAGTYNNAPSAMTNGPYTVIVTDGTDSSTVTVTMAANTFHAAYNAANDTAALHQVNKIIKSTAVAYGDTILLRDGQYGINPATGLQQFWEIQKTSEFSGTAPTSPYDANFVVIRSETVSGTVGTLGENCVASATFGAKWRKVKFITTSSFRDQGIRFKHIEFNGIGSGSANPLFDSGSGSTTVNKLQFDHNKFIGSTSDGLTTTSSNGAVLFWLKQTTYCNSFYFLDNYVYNYYNNFVLQGDDLQIIGNVFEKLYNDNKITIKGPTASVGGTYAFNFTKNRGTIPHSDDLQEDMSNVSDVNIIVTGFPAINILCNVISMGNRSSGGTPQGAPFMNGWDAINSNPVRTLDARCNNKVIRGNLYSSTQGNGIYVQNVDGLDCQWNTVVSPYDGIGVGDKPSIVLSDCSDRTVGKNIACNGVSPSYDDGTSIANIDTAAEALNTSICGFAGPTFGTNLVTLQNMIDAHTPAVGSAAEGKGAVISGVDHIAQTAVWPDAFSYVRPTPN